MSNKYYAVRSGRQQGVFTSWSHCEQQVKHYSGAQFKSFSSQAEAQAFVNGESQHAPGSGVGGSRSMGSAYGGSAAYSSSFETNREEAVEVHTDGCCEANGRAGARGGIGGFFGANDPRNFAQPLYGRQTNNRAEITAAAEAVRRAKEDGATRVVVKTDSAFLTNAMREDWGMKKWREQGYAKADGTPVVNEHDFRHLDRCCEGVDVTFEHVPGHSGIHGNEMADRLAREGARR